MGRSTLDSQIARDMNVARKVRAAGPGRPRSRKPRCACGEMTAKRAKARGHRC